MRRALFACLLVPGAAHAAPEEIQVYMDEMNHPGQFGLDVHENYVATGRLLDDYPGQQQSRYRFRITPEFSYGVTPQLELGLYLPLATVRAGRVGIDGIKTRIKYIAPHEEGGWFYGANFEIGRVDRRLDINPYNAELKTIAGRKKGHWTVAFNGNVDFVVSGPNPSPAALDVDTKIAYSLTKTLSVGLETYNGIGSFKKFGAVGDSDQTSFVTIDKSFGRWDLNLGVGTGYGTNRDRLTIKAIIGVPLDPRRG